MTAPIPRFTGDAAPYGGGDPYADYRAADLPFTHLVDLADRRLGGGAAPRPTTRIRPRTTTTGP
ncbi:hypothetical protein SMALB_7170 [Streptomyces malaysiensis]|uniref:Uncharacterized protein n=1 Tax=Streptomyces malaysiensis TaxID=92644 RepID=A0A7X6B0Z2_STRMQ|nr:hypothetical protein [Streptomyces malaysiensis]